jgi:hypothetical protein
MIRTLLHRLAERLPPPRQITDRETGTRVYLTRWYVFGGARDNDDGDTGEPLIRLPFNIFLHRFERSDDDGALHSHPWSWGVSIILAGGYSEERRIGDTVERVTFGPGSINVIRHEDFHRVDLLEEDAWSLFIAGPKLGTWFFWDRETKMRAHWRAFVDELRGAPDSSIWMDDRREPSR